MATRNIIECDRCHTEIRNPGGRRKVILGGPMGREVDLCGSCHDDLKEFLAGAKLEDPP